MEPTKLNTAPVKTIKVIMIFDPDGNVWSTPKGKATWGSVGAAKNAWACHNFKPHEYYKRISINKKWSEDAIGWEVKVVHEFDLVPRIPLSPKEGL